MKRAAVAKALDGLATPLSGRDVATAAGLPYKPTIDALAHLLDAGIVVRFGRKYSAVWALVGSPAAVRTDPLQAVETVWRAGAGRADPHPHGGEAEGTPASPRNLSVPPSKIFGA